MPAAAIPSTNVQEVFLSSVPSEERMLRRKLLQELSPLTRQGLITLWSDEELLAGRASAQELARHLQAARILLLLVSPACLASDTWQRQMETMLALARDGQARVIPVLLRETVAWQAASFGQFAPLPPGGRAVTSFKRQEEGLFAVAAGLYDLLAAERARPVISRRLRTQPPTPHPVKSIPRPLLAGEIYQRLISPGVSALVLTGLWGLGKSELAAQVCQLAEMQRQAGQGPFLATPLWLNLEETTSPHDVCATLCAAWGVALPSFQLTNADLADVLYGLLQYNQQPRLVVLDQLECWLDSQTRLPRAASPGLMEWLRLLDRQPCASRVLFTSRLYPQGRHQAGSLYRLDTYLQRQALPGLSPAEGLQLLRLGELTENDEALASVVTYYQGHSLALTWLRDLLAERRALSLTSLMQDISQKQILTDDLAHHVAEYIYMQQFNQEQRELLQAFAVYRHAVPLPAAQYLLRAHSPEQAERAGGALRVLLNHDWLQAVGQMEYRLPPLIKDLVQAQPEGNDPERVRQAHRLAAAWYRERFAVEAARHAPPPSLDDFRLLLEALWHTCQAGQPDEAAQLIQAEQLFLYLNRWGGQRLLLELYQQLLPAEQWNASSLLAGRLYHEMGVIQNALGQKEEARRSYELALPFLLQTSEPALLAETLNDLGSVLHALDQADEARARYLEAWELCKQTNEPFPQRGVTLNNLGRLLYTRGQGLRSPHQKTEATVLYEEALAFYEEALAVHRASDQPEEAAWTLLNLSDVAAALARSDQARGAYQQALEQFRALGVRRGEGTTLNNLGLLLTYEQGRKDDALSCYLQALRIFHTVGDRWQERKVLKNLGHWLLAYLPRPPSARAEAYNSGLACFFAAQDQRAAEAEPHNRRSPIPGWLVLSLRQDLGESKAEEILAAAEVRAGQIIDDLLQIPHHFL